MAKTQARPQASHTDRSDVGTTIERLPGLDVPTYYANNTGVETSLWDVRLRFAETLETDKAKKIIKVRELAYVRMSPQHARVVATILLKHLDNYEKQFGPIPAPRGEEEKS